jgi:predicted esterase
LLSKRAELWLLALAALAAPTAARSPIIEPQVSATTDRLKAGVTEIRGVGFAYLPEKAEADIPLLLLFHGAGRSARPFIDEMKEEADICGCALLAVKSAGATWDLVVNAAHRGNGSATSDKLFGADVDRVERGLAFVLSRASIDRSKIFPIGFSDGASYALSLALFNPKLFRSAIAIAPGFVLQPSMIDPGQKLYIAHGRSDHILPFANTEANIVEPLRKAGYKLEFRPFDGDHFIHRRSLVVGIAYALGRQG